MGEFINITCSIYVDPVNAATESMLDAARELVALEKQIAAAKAQLANALADRKSGLDNALVQLSALSI